MGFWVNLHASDLKTEFVYWERTLASLPGGWPDAGDWTIRAGDAVGPVGREVVRALRTVAWPAIQAALDNPGYPPDPAARWARRFPKRPRGRFPEEVEELRRAEEEVEELAERANTDPGAFRAVLARLETDPAPEIRQTIAWWLLHRAYEERSREALRAAAAEDEDVEVRWIARYALRLAGGGEPRPA